MLRALGMLREKREDCLMINDDVYDTTHVSPEEVKKHRIAFFALGIGLLLLGGIALSASTMTTFASVIFFGWLLLISGIMQAGHALWTRKGSHFLFPLMIGILNAVAGVLLILKPVTGALSLTLLLAGIFTASGLIRVVGAFFVKTRQRLWIFFNGLLTLALGVLIGLEWPTSSLWVIGLFVAIDLIFTGALFTMLAFTSNKNLTHDSHSER